MSCWSDERRASGTGQPCGGRGCRADPVGDYARQLKGKKSAPPEATILGEITNFSQSRVQIYFELRDERGGCRERCGSGSSTPSACQREPSASVRR